MLTNDLFDVIEKPQQRRLGSGTLLLEGFILDEVDTLINLIKKITTQSPFRHSITPNGYKMSVGMTHCGEYGWISDENGYRYSRIDPITQQAWPDMPALFLTLAKHAAKEAGFNHFSPTSCLINRYTVGAKLSLHQDKDEKDLSAPIVSFSLGLPALFLWGGLARHHPTKKVPLLHGDALVWGGQDRLRFHGVLPIEAGEHSLVGAQRLNLTFRQAV